LAKAKKKVTRRKGTQKPLGLNFNHAMIYSRDVGKALHFYRDLMGFESLEEMEHGGRMVYARLRAGQGDGTIALHMIEPGKELPAGDGIRLYFEVKELEKFCEELLAAGVKFSKMPKLMPWGWEHAYLDDPDGHEVSLYWAGAKRFGKSAMR
jgi:catechol 2,3-dioxygenase-like lactoylglutathione lyase family enzyme